MKNCIICGATIFNWEKYICTYCNANFPLTYFCCTENNSAEKTFREYFNIVKAYSLFFFTGNYKEIIHILKYKDHPEIGYYFGKLLGREIGKHCLAFKDHLPDNIIPVPLHWTRHLKRGYNQAEIISKGISAGIKDILGVSIPVNTNAIKRVHVTKTQTRKNREDRQANMIMAFAPINRRRMNINLRHNFLHCLVVDDVFTTGATLNAAVNAVTHNKFLKNAAISIATLAFVE